MTAFKLPEPDAHNPEGAGAYFDSYTETKLKQALRDVLEQAARVCESMQAGWASDHHLACAAAIRKMIGEI